MRIGALVACGLAVSVSDAVADASVMTASSGRVVVSCADARGWTFDLATIGQPSCDVVTVRMRSERESVPPEFSVDFELPGTAVQHVWTCDASKDAYHLWPDVWDEKSRSQLASGTPIAVAFDGDEHALAGIACSEVYDKVEFSLALTVDARALRGRLPWGLVPIEEKCS